MVKATVNSSTPNRVSINADDRQAIRIATLPAASSSDTTAREYANGAWTTANSALITANSAYDKANAANVLANSSYTFANTVNAIAVAAFAAANSGVAAASAYDKANAANSLAFSAYGFANTVNIQTVAGFAQSNIALLTASSAYDKANAVNLYTDNVSTNATAAFNKANLANIVAEASFAAGNTTYTYASNNVMLAANSAYDAANSTYTYAANVVMSVTNAAFSQANGANIVPVGNTMANGYFTVRSTKRQINLIPGANITIDVDDDPTLNTANITITSTVTAVDPGPAFDKANAANILASDAYGFANTVNLRVVAAYAQSNIALLVASSSYDKANAVNLYVDTVNSNVTAAFTKANNALANTDGIHTAGRLNVSNHLVVFGNITTAQTVTAQHFDNVSDETLKENIHTILISTSVLDKLNPVSFNWKSSGELSYGLIAQEVENILPQIVHTSGNIKTVSYIQLIAFLIAAVKDLQEQINSINTKL